MENKKYFPMFVDLTGWDVLVVGAGAIGARRAEILAEFGAQVTVVAPEYRSKNQEHRSEHISWIPRAFEDEDLKSKYLKNENQKHENTKKYRDLVIAATSDPELNDHIAALCRKRQIRVNHAGDHTQCDFYFPAIAEKEDLILGITSSGKDHRKVRSFAARLREWLEQLELEKKE